ncbi:MAG TPA: M14 family metallocarboxypeptidase [Lachnospiraceae bacterium]|nr:M14 family metallocarboxypeptidase [Lachnospiraceae bacterium]
MEKRKESTRTTRKRRNCISHVRKRIIMLTLILVLQPLNYMETKGSGPDTLMDVALTSTSTGSSTGISTDTSSDTSTDTSTNTSTDTSTDTKTEQPMDTITDDNQTNGTQPDDQSENPTQDSTQPTTDNPTDTNTSDPSSEQEVTDTAVYKEVNETVYFKKAYSIYSKPNMDSDKVDKGILYKKYTRVGVGSEGWDKLLIDEDVIYVKAKYITKSKPTVPSNIVNKDDILYSYTDMEKDLQLLSKYYPDYVSLSSIGTTVDKRNIYCAVLGNQDASKQIIIQGSMHAREYINSQLLMMELEYYLSKYEIGAYSKVKYSKLFSDVSIHIIPMVNPDGVTLSQYGLKGINSKNIVKRLKVIRKGSSYTLWKANVRGVDLNRNYPFGWTKKSTSLSYGAMNFPGPSSVSELETKAMIDYTESLPNLKAAISYHSMGSIIYWNYGQKGKLLLKCIGLVSIAKSFTNYRLMPLSSLPSHGGYSDWVVMTLGIPAITIETGTTIAPVKHWELPSIYSKNRDIIAAVALKYQ